MVRKLTKRDYITTAWSGGASTQLVIEPEGASYADRDFLWRVSSASVELEASDFTPLPDYERLISTLKGAITLTHNEGLPIALHPYEVHAFSGADMTRSLGRCTDFNLMLRRGKAVGSMELLKLTETPTAPSAAAHSLRHDAAEQLLLCCIEGTAQINQIPLAPGETLLLSGETNLKLTGPAMLMLCRMRRL